MSFDKNAIIELTKEALDIHYTRIHFAGKDNPPPREESTTCLPWYRICTLLEGESTFEISENGKITTVHRKPDVCVVVPPYAWNTVDWKSSKSRGFSVVLEHDYLRVVYLNHMNKNAPIWPPTYYYHVEDTISPAVVYAMRSLCAMADNPPSQKCALRMMRSVLELTLNDLERSESPQHGKAYFTWLKIVTYIHDVFQENPSRTEISEKFKLTDGYISRLFTKYAKMSFNDYVSKLRLEKAVSLLTETDLTLDEIAWQCGYNYTSYFIKLFRRTHSLTPTQFRRRLPKKEKQST